MNADNQNSAGVNDASDPEGFEDFLKVYCKRRTQLAKDAPKLGKLATDLWLLLHTEALTGIANARKP